MTFFAALCSHMVVIRTGGFVGPALAVTYGDARAVCWEAAPMPWAGNILSPWFTNTELCHLHCQRLFGVHLIVIRAGGGIKASPTLQLEHNYVPGTVCGSGVRV